jgi:hypothetical protein
MTNVCVANQCVAAMCTDGVKNAMETDIDCGGPQCAQCATDLGCAAASDCVSGVCAGGKCVAPSCSDAVKNGTESDVDCGGIACMPCVVGATCNANSDCVTGICTANVCASPDLVGATVRDVSASFSIAIPTGTIPGDLLVLLVAHGGGGGTIPIPTGWTEIQDGSHPGSGDPKLDAFTRTYVSGSSVSVTMTNSGGSAILASFRGFVYGAQGSVDIATFDNIITTQTSALLFVSATNAGLQIPSKPTGFTAIAIGNGNSRSVRLSYSKGNPANAYTLTAVTQAGEVPAKVTFAMALY